MIKTFSSIPGVRPLDFVIDFTGVFWAGYSSLKGVNPYEDLVPAKFIFCLGGTPYTIEERLTLTEYADVLALVSSGGVMIKGQPHKDELDKAIQAIERHRLVKLKGKAVP